MSVSSTYPKLSASKADCFGGNSWCGNMVITMVKTARLLLICWMTVWLPLSGAMAMVMPYQWTFDSPSTDVVAVAGNVESSLPCHVAMAADPTPDAGVPDACLHCDLCHLANALIAPAIPVVLPDHVHAPTPAWGKIAFASHIPELPQRPPRLAIA
jgi:hypothetical protein